MDHSSYLDSPNTYKVKTVKLLGMPDSPDVDGRCCAGAATTSARCTEAGLSCQAQGPGPCNDSTCAGSSTGQAILDDDISAALADKYGVAAPAETSCTPKGCRSSDVSSSSSSSSSVSNNTVSLLKTNCDPIGCDGALSKAAAATASPRTAPGGTGSDQGKIQRCTASAQGCNSKSKSNDGCKSNNGCKPAVVLQEPASSGKANPANIDSDGSLITASWLSLLSLDG